MTARYATSCRLCLSPIQPGEEIAKATDGWAHGACAAGGAATDSPAVKRPAAKRESASSQPTAAAKAKRAATRPARPDMPTAARRARGVDGRSVLGQPRPRWMGLGDPRRAPRQRRRRASPPTSGWRSRPRWRRCGATGPAHRRERLDLRRQLLPRRVVARLARARLDDQRPKKPVANRDLWEPLVTLVNERGDVGVPMGEGPLRRRDERPRRPDRRRGVRARGEPGRGGLARSVGPPHSRSADGAPAAL